MLTRCSNLLRVSSSSVRQMITVSPRFGTHSSGKDAKLWTMKNEAGYAASVTDYGATLVRMVMPDREGKCEDCVLGFDSVEEYVADSPYFGATCGRVANRIAQGKFSLDRVDYQLAINNGENSLHGGEVGWDKQLWEASSLVSSEGPSVTFMRYSPDAEEGYPGTVEVRVTYTLTNANELRIEMEATTDQATPINMAHHSYWNLAGHASGTILDHEVMLNSTSLTPVGDDLIPTGQIEDVSGSCRDLSRGVVVGTQIDRLRLEQTKVWESANGGFDFNYVVKNSGWGKIVRAARVCDPASGRVMEVYSNQPGIQLYTGSWIEGPLAAKGGATYEKYSGLCLETQLYPDSINQEDNDEFPSCVLNPGELYHHVMIHKFSVE